MSYTIGCRMPMRDRPRVRVRLVYDIHGDPTEATTRAMERLAGMPDGTVVEAFQVMVGGERGGNEKVKPPEPSEPSGLPLVFAVWNRGLCVAYRIEPGGVPAALLSPSGLAYPSEDGGMSFGLPTDDALSALVTADVGDTGWLDEAVSSMPDGSMVEVRWQEDGETVDREMYMMYGRELARLVDPSGSGGSGGSGGAS